MGKTAAMVPSSPVSPSGQLLALTNTPGSGVPAGSRTSICRLGPGSSVICSRPGETRWRSLLRWLAWKVERLASAPRARGSRTIPPNPLTRRCSAVCQRSSTQSCRACSADAFRCTCAPATGCPSGSCSRTSSPSSASSRAVGKRVEVSRGASGHTRGTHPGASTWTWYIPISGALSAKKPCSLVTASASGTGSRPARTRRSSSQALLPGKSRTWAPGSGCCCAPTTRPVTTRFARAGLATARKVSSPAIELSDRATDIRYKPGSRLVGRRSRLYPCCD